MNQLDTSLELDGHKLVGQEFKNLPSYKFLEKFIHKWGHKLETSCKQPNRLTKNSAKEDGSALNLSRVYIGKV